jgi:hypothetical protein
MVSMPEGGEPYGIYAWGRRTIWYICLREENHMVYMPEGGEPYGIYVWGRRTIWYLCLREENLSFYNNYITKVVCRRARVIFMYLCHLCLFAFSGIQHFLTYYASTMTCMVIIVYLYLKCTVHNKRWRKRRGNQEWTI